MALWTIPNDPNLPARTRRALQRAINAVLNKSASAVTVGTVASATTLEMATVTSEVVTITGTTTIAGINEENAGACRRMIFEGVLTLTNSDSFALLTNADVQTRAGDFAEFYSLGGGDWIMTIYVRATGGQLGYYNYKSSSVTTLTIGFDSFVKTAIIDIDLGYTVGTRVRFTSSASPSNWMEGVVTAYTSGPGSGAISFFVDNYNGSGTFGSWNVNLGSFALTAQFLAASNANYLSVATYFDKLQLTGTVASASLIDVSLGVFWYVTGSTTINEIGNVIGYNSGIKVLAFQGALTLHHSGLLRLPTSADIVTAANDVAIFEVDYDGLQRCISYMRADGTPLVGIIPAGTRPFTGDQSMGSHKLTNVTDPTSAQDAATKNYVDVAVAAVETKQECTSATTTALAAGTYNNGSSGVGATFTLTVSAVLILDGYTPALNDRLLIKNQASAFQNGIYKLTTVGVLGVTQAVLTRTTDFDQDADGIDGAMVYVLNGTVNANTLWTCTTTGVVTVGTTNINWSQFLGSTYTADESTLHLSGSTFSIKSTYTGQSSIVTVGTLTGGATGAGFTIALTTSTVTGTLPVANLTSLTTLTAADVALADEIPEYNIAATANRKITATKLLGQSSSSICEGRLTLTSATSVTTSDVTGATSIYFTPHNGDRITIYDGTRLLMYSFTELTLALGTLVNAQGYDVFIYDNAGTLTLEALEWTNATITCTSASPGVVTWTAHGLATGNSVTFTNSGGGLPTGISANVQYWITKIDANTFKISTTMANVAAGTFVNTSSTGTGTHTGHSPTLRATALVRQNGAWYKTGALTRRYLGSFFTTATTTTESSLANRYLFNAYNQIQLPMKVQDSTSSWNYTTAAFRQARATDGNRINFFNGLAEKQVEATVVAFASDTSNGMMLSGIGLDSTSTDSSILSINNNAASNFISTTFAQYKAQPSIGFHSLVWLEYAQALGTASWYGQGSANVGNLGHSGLSASIWC